MQDPEVYVQVNSTPGRITKELMLSKYLEFFQWRHENDETILDVGCGPGNNTWDIIKPILPSQAKLFGLDISNEMIVYAAKMYPDIDFFVLDIGTSNLPEKLCNAFDHVFSSFCLHWVLNQRCAMNNIYRMLKPGGDMFCHYLGTCPFFEVFYNSSQMKQWKSYINDADKYLSAFYKKDVQYIEKELRNILTEAGFKIIVCEIIRKQIVLSNLSELRDVIASIHPHISKIPKNLREAFLDDSVEEFLKLNSEENLNNGDEVVHEIDLIVLVASKS